MDSKKAEALREKYWEGKSSLEEEKELKNYFLHAHDEYDLNHEYFSYLNKKTAQNPLSNQFDRKILNQIGTNKLAGKSKNKALKYWLVAASIAFIISVSIISKYEFYRGNKVESVVEVDTYKDPAKAFEETKKALLLLSSMLNQSDEYTTQFSKFDQSQTILTQN